MNYQEHPFYLFGAGVVAGIIGAYSFFSFNTLEGYVKKENVIEYVKKSGLNDSVCKDLSMFDRKVISEHVIKTGFTHLVCKSPQEKIASAIENKTVPETEKQSNQSEILTVVEIDEPSKTLKMFPNDSEPRPDVIADKISDMEKTSPFNSKVYADSFKNLKVHWTLYLYSVSLEGDELWISTYSLNEPLGFPLVSFYLDAEEYAYFKTLGKDHEIKVSGTIESAEVLFIRLNGVSVQKTKI
ncbi:hypothetical protein P0I94_004394 [Vibrio vulnificus]|nr:hypothetical protein [Vibrio vulnificus]